MRNAELDSISGPARSTDPQACELKFHDVGSHQFEEFCGLPACQQYDDTSNEPEKRLFCD
jgi:hypothetical protein